MATHVLRHGGNGTDKTFVVMMIYLVYAASKVYCYAWTTHTMPAICEVCGNGYRDNIFYLMKVKPDALCRIFAQIVAK